MSWAEAWKVTKDINTLTYEQSIALGAVDWTFRSNKSNLGVVLDNYAGIDNVELKTCRDIDEIISNPVAMNAITASPAAMKVINNSSIAIAKYAVSLAGLDHTEYADIETVAASPVAINAICASPEAIDTIAASPVARVAVTLGATWDKNASPILIRTDAAVGMVANAGVDDEIVRNDFDQAPIYRNITEATDSQGNVFVRIPKLYIKKNDGLDLRSWQISPLPLPGFYLPWCFWDFTNERELPYIDVGKYNATLAGDKLESKPGLKPLVNKTIVDFRTYAKNNGNGYQQYDIHVHDVITVLFYVEFATLNSQSIMAGLTSGSAAAESGFSVNIAASSGSPTSNASGAYPCMYRGIENPWGSVFQFVDGLNINDHQAWVAKNAEDYASNVFAHPYEKVSYVNASASGYVTEMGIDFSMPWAELPVGVGGTESTYYSDDYYQGTGQRIARVGGAWTYAGGAGVSCWGLPHASSYAYTGIGGRLLKKPL